MESTLGQKHVLKPGAKGIANGTPQCMFSGNYRVCGWGRGSRTNP